MKNNLNARPLRAKPTTVNSTGAGLQTLHPSLFRIKVVYSYVLRSLVPNQKDIFCEYAIIFELFGFLE